MTDIKTDPTLAEWIGIHDELKTMNNELILIVNKLISMQDEDGKLRSLVQIIADREY